MQTTSALYKQIIADENHSFEVKFDIAGTEYGMDVIFSARGTAKTFETEPTIGGVYSATFDFSLLTDGASIPRMAKVIPYFRATDGARASEWIKKGEFYIDVRSVTSNGDGLSVFKAQCFDGMLKANAPYANSSLSWPATDTAVVAEICTALGFTQDARNAGIMTAGYSIPSAPVDLTYRDVLSYIAAMYGANWIMTDAGELLLLPLGEGADTLTVGNNVQNLNVSPKRNGYTKVILETSEGVAIESGASDEVVITAFCPYATQAIADAVLTALSSFEYQPFGAVGVWADPAVEIGDNMSAVTTIGTVFSREIEFGTGMVMNLSAPNDNYTDHEYSYESPTERRYKRSIGRLRSEISIQEGKISLVVSETSGGNVVNAASIVTAINESGSSVIISADKIDLEGYVTVTDLSTQGQTVINGANITTGLIQDAQRKNYWNLDTGEFRITNGTINITTDSSTQDIIRLIWAGGDETLSQKFVATMTSGHFSSSFTQTENGIVTEYRDTYYGSFGPSGPSAAIPSTSPQLFTGGSALSLQKPFGSLRLRNHNTGALISMQSGSKYPYQDYPSLIINEFPDWESGSSEYITKALLTADGINFWNDNKKRTVRLFTWGRQAHGSLYLYDGTSDALRTWLDYTGLKFADASGTQTGTYPANFKAFKYTGTTSQQYFVINDSSIKTGSIVFVQPYYSSSSVTIFCTPQITADGTMIVYCRSTSGTIADGTQVVVNVLVVGG